METSNPASAAGGSSSGMALEPIPVGGTPSPTVTHYQQLANGSTDALNVIAGTIPKLEAEHVSTIGFVRGHLNIPLEFLATVVAAVENNPELLALQKLDPLAGRDTLQFIEAFQPVLDKLEAFWRSLKFTMDSRRAALASESLQVYYLTKGLVRDPGSAGLTPVVANMKRDLGDRGPKKKPAPKPDPTAPTRPAAEG